MTTITIAQFQQDTEQILAKLRQGESFVLTSHGAAIAKLEPIESKTIPAEIAVEADPFFQLIGMIQEPVGSLSNKELDAIIYEP